MNIVAKPIEMLASFTKNGIPTPIRFRYHHSEDESIVVKVEHILYKELEKSVGNPMMVFRCESVIEGALKTYELKYELATCKWMLFRM